MHGIRWFCASALVASAFAAPPVQLPILDSLTVLEGDEIGHIEKKRALHGRFLQVTGMTNM